uniref:Sister chromatid cohesion protein DCC1 n=1 Tax=Panagrellus redivivus TaxID=6233 RepID=A0A7E4VPC3_PANRE
MITNDSPDSVTFDEGFNSGRYRLIQVTKELAEHVRQGKTLVVRGQPKTNLCLCTDDATYRVREVETTDTLFVTNVNQVESIGTGKDYRIRAYLKTFLELTKDEMSPYLALKTLLEKYEYDLNDSNAEETISFDEVLDIIQFSEAEIRAAMERLPVVEYDALLRYLKRSFREDMLGKLVDVIDDYTIDGISTKEMDRTAMREFFSDEYPVVFIDWLHRTYALPNGTPNHKAICRDRAVELLSKENSLGITAFERKMSNLLPIGTEFDSEALKGVAIIKNTVGRGQIVEYLNVEDMPPDSKQRLEILFKVQPSWSAEDIEPYVIDFCTSKASVGAFLLKNCQSVKEGNAKVFIQKNNDF